MVTAMGQEIWILNGPNLNLLGAREPETYGTQTLTDIITECQNYAHANGYSLVTMQSNHEGQLIDWLQEAGEKAVGVVINAGGYTHTSIALHDALKALTIPSVEVHLSNLWKREDWRHHSYLSSVVNGVIAGFGGNSYILALQALITILTTKTKA